MRPQASPPANSKFSQPHTQPTQENKQNQTVSPITPPQQPKESFPPSSLTLSTLKRNKKFIVIGLITLFLILAGGIALFFYLQNKKFEKTTAQPESSTPLKQIQTIGWKTYQSETLHIEFKYPSDWSLKENTEESVENSNIKLNDPDKIQTISIGLYTSIAAFAPPSASCDEVKIVCEYLNTPHDTTLILWYKLGNAHAYMNYPLKKFYSLSIGYDPNTSGKSDLTFEEKEFFRTFLSTFKFTNNISPTPPPDQYSPDDDWQLNKTTLTRLWGSEGQHLDWKTVSVCLPPKWDFDPTSQATIKYYRDPGYAPDATSIGAYSYNGGSRRQEYIDLKLRGEPELKPKTTVKEININGQSFLQITIPSFPEVLLTVIDNTMYTINIDYKLLVTDSKSAFEKDIKTIASCLKPL